MTDVRDRVTADGAEQILLALHKQLNDRDPRVVLLAFSLLDSLWNNCSAIFRREVSSEEFISELHCMATHRNRVIGEKTRELLKKWSENECKTDASLSLVETLVRDLANSGYSFESSTIEKVSKDPNVVTTLEQEDADIARGSFLLFIKSKLWKKYGVLFF